MKLTIKTKLLNELLSKADKCASNNKMLPITGMLCIQVKSGKLTLTTTNGYDYLFVDADINADDFYAVVDEQTLVKLVSKTTSDVMTLELIDTHMEVIGNGKYSIELPVDENGMLVKFPNPLNNLHNIVESFVITYNALDLILKTNKIAVSASLAEPCYTGYYFNDYVITSDRTIICCNDLKLTESPKLIGADLMNVLSVFNSDINVSITDTNNIIFTGDTCTAFGHLMNEVDEYNADAIVNLLNMNLPNSCEVNRTALLNVLDRLSLFVSTYDRNAITLKFTKEYLEITNANSHAIERVLYASVTDTAEQTYCVDIELLKKLVSVQSGNVVEVHYGNDIFIKLIDGDTIQLIPLLTE